MSNYRLDKTHFKAQTFEEADHQKAYWLQKEVKERIKAAWYLVSCAYGFSLDDQPPMDKSAFSMRKHNY
ncbi:MAG: hypothetical protein KAQ79_17410 [Cyclobacteriaceae bacterium]|nr:hypothetical protein [Cyclobacteriaceae bacterium]